MSLEYHVEITLACYNENDSGTMEKYELVDTYQEKFRCYPNNLKELPCNALDAHGIDGGLCFTFATEKDVVYAHAHILETSWFLSFLRNNPKYYFDVHTLGDEELDDADLFEV